MKPTLAIKTLVCAWLGLLGASAHAAASTAEPLFADHSLLELRIEAPFRQIFRDREDPAESQAGVLTYVEADGSQQALDVKLKARGIFRRQPEICDYPPLRVNFKKKQVDGTVFEGQDKLKLVTHCGRNQRATEQFVLKEYLAYRIFNEITERSFRVRLLNVTYAEPGGKRERSNFAFFIESKDSLAQRNGASVQDLVRIRPSELDRVHTSLAEVFQFLIGNTDFSMTSGAEDACCHNVVPIASAPGTYYIVPYDFDFAGLVSPPYATPAPSLRIRNVRQRLYRGMCLSNDHLAATLETFNRTRAAIEALPAEIPGMSDRSIRSTGKYIAEFYSTINDPRSVERELLDKCR